MAIAIRGTTPGVTTGAGDPTSVVLNGTRQPNSGDVLIIIHSNDFYDFSNMPTPTVGGSSTGVTAITNGSFDEGSNGSHTKSYYYVVGSTGDLTVAVDETGSADEEKALIVYVLSGVDTTTPIDVAANAVTGIGSFPHPAPSVSPTSSDAFLICHLTCNQDGGATTPPGSMTEQYDSVVLGFMTVTGATEQLSASGATGTRTFTSTNLVDNVMFSIAVKTGTGGVTERGSRWLTSPLAGMPFAEKQAPWEYRPVQPPVPMLVWTNPTTPADQSISLSDTATADDSLTVPAAIPLADTAAGTDALALAAALPLTDTASASDDLTVAAAAALTDTAVAGDALAVATALTLADTASADDVLTAAVAIPLADTASVVDDLDVAGAFERTNQIGSISNTTSTFGTGAYTSGSFTPPNDSLLVVSSATLENGGSTACVGDMTVTDSVGLTWTSRASQGADTTFSTGVRVWTAPVTTGTSMTVSVDCGSRDMAFYVLTVVAYTGYNTSSPVGATGTNSQSGGFSGPPDPASVTLSANPASSSEVFAAVGLNGNSSGATVDPGSGWTEIFDGRNNDWGGGQSEARGSSTSTSVSWADLRNPTGALFNYAAVAVEIKAASGDAAVGLADTASAADALSLAAAVPLSDTASAADALTVAVALTLVDTATADDSLAVLSDATAPAPPGFLSPFAELPFAAPAPWEGGLNKGVVVLEVWTSPPTPSGDLNIGLTDTATADDSLTVAVALALADTATTSEALTAGVPISLDDTATGSDSLSLAAAVSLTETASADDALAVTVALALADTAVAVEALTAGVPITLSDTAAAVDALSVQISGAEVTLTETASAADSLAITVVLALADTASATESINIPEAPLQSVVSRITTGRQMSRASTGTDARRIASGAQMTRASSGTDARRVSTGHQMSRIVSSQEE